ncbi:MAG: extracellular solute-binding protein [Propionibacteriales bacterium]|nr:extracellular solute-binding protein [Propionibacteriales bacterium]
MRARKFLIFPAVVVAGGLLVACGGDESNGGGSATGEGAENGVVVQMDGESREDYLTRLEEAAIEEGTVTYYQSAGDEELQAIVDAWNAAYPDIEFEPVSATSGTILERALLESESGNVRGDVYGGGAGDQAALDAAGALEEYRPVNEADVIEEFKMDGPYIAVGTLTFHPAFNTTLAEESDLPEDWMGYCDEDWRGKLAIDQEGGEWATGILSGMGEEDGMKFLECLAGNEPRLVRGSTNRTELLASGEFPVMLDGYGHRIWEFEQQGAPIRGQRPSPAPLPVVLDMASIFADSPHPNAARLLMEFFLTAEGQQVFLDQNKPGTLTTQEQPYAELMEGAEVTVLGPEEANFDEGFKIFADLFLGGGAPAL